jgi:spore coat protein U-like protein
MKRLLLAVAASSALLAVIFLAPRARAAQATNTLTVTANVIASCQIAPAALAFGNYDTTQNDATGSITVTCNQGATYWIGLGLGSNASGAQRRMQLAGSFLNYELFRDAGRTQIWDNADPGAGVYTLTAGSTGAQPALTVYGRVAANQVVPQGNNYTDTVTMTVNF